MRGIGCGVEGDGWWEIALFNKGNMVQVENTISSGIPEAISLGIGSVTYNRARNGAMK